MKILILGSGGREHALGLRLIQDREVSQVFILPGNPGMGFHPQVTPLSELKFDFETAAAFVQKEGISFVLIRPEAPLFQGWVDQFQKKGIPAFGPTNAAAFLEASKILAKKFMKQQGIPTADFESAKTREEALLILENKKHWEGFVLKLSGPALGKGVVVTQSKEEAQKVVKDFFDEKTPGIEEGLVIEEKISGREASLFYVCLEDEFRFLSSACDHKRLLDHDLGPNTGGMGAYSPAHWLSEQMLAVIENQFVKPTLSGMKERGTPFCGILFLGLMFHQDKPHLLEYNVRFGDPETQAILPRVSGDLASLLDAVSKKDFKRFRSISIFEQAKCSVHVVKAAKGYPGLWGEDIESGQEIKINGPLQNECMQFYFAGVKGDRFHLLSSGGRILGVTAVADSLFQAKELAYLNLKNVSFSGEQFRTDIGGRE